LLEKAMDRVADKDYGNLKGVLSGPTSIMFAEVGNLPAKVIKDFRKKNAKPILKGAYIEESIYVGDDQLDALESIKSKDELIGEIIGLLQSPAKNVVSGLKGQGGKIAGILKTLSERA
jgi:large subunit ribosomal protein L10